MLKSKVDTCGHTERAHRVATKMARRLSEKRQRGEVDDMDVLGSLDVLGDKVVNAITRDMESSSGDDNT